jgi:hypothetical protein
MSHEAHDTLWQIIVQWLLSNFGKFIKVRSGWLLVMNAAISLIIITDYLCNWNLKHYLLFFYSFKFKATWRSTINLQFDQCDKQN